MRSFGGFILLYFSIMCYNGKAELVVDYRLATVLAFLERVVAYVQRRVKEIK